MAIEIDQLGSRSVMLERFNLFHIVGILAVVLLSIPAAGHAAREEKVEFSGYTAFGDSLSDKGNTFMSNVTGFIVVMTNRFNRAFYSNSTRDEAGRFSNGPTWAEVLHEELGFGVMARNPGTRIFGTNYAWAGAESGSGGIFVNNLLRQTSDYIRTNRDKDRETRIYSVWIGGNDIVNAVTSGSRININQIVLNVSNALNDLYDAGARHFLVPNLPDLGSVPAIGQENPRLVGSARTLSKSYNAALASLVRNFVIERPEAHFYEVNIFDTLGDIIRDPASYGLTNATHPVYVSDRSATGGGRLVGNPDTFLFWDSMHPTRGIHRSIAQTAMEELALPSIIVPSDSSELLLQIAEGREELFGHETKAPRVVVSPSKEFVRDAILNGVHPMAVMAFDDFVDLALSEDSGSNDVVAISAVHAGLPQLLADRPNKSVGDIAGAEIRVEAVTSKVRALVDSLASAGISRDLYSLKFSANPEVAARAFDKRKSDFLLVPEPHATILLRTGASPVAGAGDLLSGNGINALLVTRRRWLNDNLEEARQTVSVLRRTAAWSKRRASQPALRKILRQKLPPQDIRHARAISERTFARGQSRFFTTGQLSAPRISESIEFYEAIRGVVVPDNFHQRHFDLRALK